MRMYLVDRKLNKNKSTKITVIYVLFTAIDCLLMLY
jgi:hypothetical protein